MKFNLSVYKNLKAWPGQAIAALGQVLSSSLKLFFTLAVVRHHLIQFIPEGIGMV